MTEKAGKSSKIAAFILIVVNLIVTIVCALLFSLCLWMISSPATMSDAVQRYGTPGMKVLLSRETLTWHLGAGAAALAAFFFCFSLMGLYGACSRSPFLLFMYATLVLLLLLLECSLLYYFSSTLRERGLLEQDGQWTHAMRLAFQCCERNTTIREASPPPWSCCGTAGFPDNCTARMVFSKNCNETIPAFLDRYGTAMYATLAVAHVLLSSCSLVRRARPLSHSHS